MAQSMMTVRAASLHQPYASLILAEIKTLETRTWPPPRTTPFPFDLLICSTARKPLDVPLDILLAMPLGVALCMVTVTGARPMEKGDEERAFIELYPRAWVWELTNVRPVRQISVVGRQRIYRLEVPTDIFDR